MFNFTSIIISKNCYNDLIDQIDFLNPHFFEEYGGEWVECDVVWEIFEFVAKETGWI